MGKYVFPEPTFPKGYEVGNTSSRPASPTLGDIYSNTQTGYIEVYTASGWSQLGVIPLSATIGTATDVGTGREYNNGAVSVTFTPNAGGGLASNFTATSTSGGYSASGTSSPIVVPSIPVGTSATFTVTATNGYGNALASSASNSATTTTVPQTPNIGTPTNVTGAAFGSTASASVPVTANATGGKSVSGFTVTSTPGSLVGSGTSPVTVAGLTSGTSYTFRAVATNANGNSAATSASSSLTPSTVPQTPTIGTATRTDFTTVSIPFTAGATGGQSITSYTVTSTPSIALTVSGSASPLTVTGSFEVGVQYTFKIAAVNANGTSAQSSASNGLTPWPTPTATLTGGTLTSDATYYYRTFSSNGTLGHTGGQITLNLFLAGGGGGGGYGGGGGGGYPTVGSDFVMNGSSKAITIGGGGGGSFTGGNGTASSIAGVSGTSTGAGGSGANNAGAGGAPNGGAQGGDNGNNGGTGTSAFSHTIRYGGGGGGSGCLVAGAGGADTGGSSRTRCFDTYPSAGGITGGGGGGGSARQGASGGGGVVVVRYLKKEAVS